MNYYINCFTWNDILPVQYFWEETCGYYAMRNGNFMYKILKDINIYTSRKNYINEISKNKNFKSLISVNQNIRDISNFKNNFIEKKENLSGNDIIYINKKCEPNIDLNVYYNPQEIKLNLNQKNSINYIIMYRSKFNISKHWIPFIVHKIGNNINIHILDSFNTSWVGDTLISGIIRNIKNNNKNINYIINCKDNSTISAINMIYQKISSVIILFIFILLLVNSTLKSNL